MRVKNVESCAHAREYQLLLFRADSTASLRDFSGHITDAVAHEDRAFTMELALNDVSEGDSIAGEVATRESLPDAILSLYGDDARNPFDTARRLAMRIRPLLDQQASSVLVADRYQLLPGHGPVRIYYGLHRLERLSRQEFQHYWLHTHADIGRRLIPPYSYIQSHADAGLTGAFADACGLGSSTLDGIVTVHFPDLQACRRQLAREDVGEIALEDERRFIDHNRVQFGVYSVRRWETGDTG